VRQGAALRRGGAGRAAACSAPAPGLARPCCSGRRVCPRRPCNPPPATAARSFDTPLWYGNAELQLLRGTTLARAMELRRRTLEAQWKRLAPAAQELLQRAAGAGETAALGFEDWLWAYSVFWSRWAAGVWRYLMMQQLRLLAGCS
jgi:hypothetical protein